MLGVLTMLGIYQDVFVLKQEIIVFYKYMYMYYTILNAVYVNKMSPYNNSNF